MTIQEAMKTNKRYRRIGSPCWNSALTGDPKNWYLADMSSTLSVDFLFDEYEVEGQEEEKVEITRSQLHDAFNRNSGTTCWIESGYESFIAKNLGFKS